MKTVKHYRNPVQVQAFQYPDSLFIDKVKEHLQWQQIDFTYDMETRRSFLAPCDKGVVSIEYIVECDRKGFDVKDVEIHEGDWFVLEPGQEPAFYADSEFRDRFFTVETETKRTLPKLEQLI